MNLRKGAWRLPSCAAHSNAILFNTCQRRRRRVMSFYFGYATKRQPAQPDGPQAHQANPFLGLRKHHPLMRAAVGSCRILMRLRSTILVPRTHTFCENRARLNDGRQVGLKGSASKEPFLTRRAVLGPYWLDYNPVMSDVTRMLSAHRTGRGLSCRAVLAACI